MKVLLIFCCLFFAVQSEAFGRIRNEYFFPVSMIKTELRQVGPNSFIGPISVLRQKENLQIIIDSNKCTAEGVCSQEAPMILDGLVLDSSESPNFWQIQVVAQVNELVSLDPNLIRILWLVISKQGADAEIRTLEGNYPATVYVWVIKSDEAVTCRPEAEIKLQTMKEQLQAQGVRIVRASKGAVGLIQSEVCGQKMPTVNAFLINKNDENLAYRLNFTSLRAVPEAVLASVETP